MVHAMRYSIHHQLRFLRGLLLGGLTCRSWFEGALRPLSQVQQCIIRGRGYASSDGRHIWFVNGIGLLHVGAPLQRCQASRQ